MLEYDKVAVCIAQLSRGSPLFEITGKMPSPEKPDEAVCSYLSVHEGLVGKAKMYNSKYAQFVIDYAVEWERVVTARVVSGLKKAEQLRVDLDHYQEKVESMRQAANKSMAAGKMVDPKAAERLQRNEEKLLRSRQEHGKFTNDLCLLMEEVTERSWRDLHPLLVKIAQFDVTLSDDEAKSMGKLNQAVNELKRLATNHGIKPQARLKEIDSQDPTLLSTKEASPSNPQLEDGSVFGTLSLDGVSGAFTTDPVSPSSALNTSAGDLMMPANMGGGMGGFPVMQASSNTGYDMNRQTSFGSSSSAPIKPSTLDMLAINASAAPPPTLDQINATLAPPGIRSAPTSGAVDFRNRNYSLDSIDSAFGSNYSGYSGASAPPPAAPPPPPPPPLPTPQNFGAPASSFGTPSPGFGGGVMGGPQSGGYGMSTPSNALTAYGATPTSSYGAPPPAPHSYGAPPSYAPAPSSFGGPPTLSMYSNIAGAPPPPPNPFGGGNQNYAAPSPMGGQQQPSYPMGGNSNLFGQASSPYGQPPSSSYPNKPGGGGSTNPFD